MRKISKEERKAYNEYVEQHNQQNQAGKFGLVIYAIVCVALCGFIVFNTRDEFWLWVAEGLFGLAVVFVLLSRLIGIYEHNHFNH